jgi:hypothetical protein
MTDLPLTPIEIGLTAAIVAVEGEEPSILVAGDAAKEGARGAHDEARAGLPFGPFDPLTHRTFEIGLRAWVEAQTGLSVGYVEQLYTFGDRGRHARPGDTGAHVVSIGYLALTRTPENAALASEASGQRGHSTSARAGHSPEEGSSARAALASEASGQRGHSTSARAAALRAAGAGFEPWYRFFPWEDWREKRPEILDKVILPQLEEWAGRAVKPEAGRPLSRRERVRLCFGATRGAAPRTPASHFPWDEEKALERYELLYEAGLVEEARRDGREAALARGRLAPLGEPMRFDHRRILATAIARLRGKLKYRPVVFELMPPEFTLTELQRTVEAVSGRRLHKQNFRRVVETAALVEPTGDTLIATGGRPAALFRFRREVVQERPAPGLRLGTRAS